MEEKKKIMWKKIAWRSVNIIIAALVLGGVFALSVWAGVAAVVSLGLGFLFGYFKRSHKEQRRFWDMLLENKEEFFAGKTVVINLDAETNELTAKILEGSKDESEKETTKKKKEVQED